MYFWTFAEIVVLVVFVFLVFNDFNEVITIVLPYSLHLCFIMYISRYGNVLTDC